MTNQILTSVVLTEGLELKLVPVRTSQPIPREKMLEGMAEIKKIRLKMPIKSGDVIAANFLGLGVDLIATRGSN